jgi:hypothetical protein
MPALSSSLEAEFAAGRAACVAAAGAAVGAGADWPAVAGASGDFEQAASTIATNRATILEIMDDGADSIRESKPPGHYA